MTFTKALFTLACVFGAATAHAAKIERITEMSKNKLQLVYNAAEELGQEYQKAPTQGDSFSFGVEAVKFKRTNKAELLENTIKQAIYKLHSNSGSITQEVRLERLSASPENIELALNHSVRMTRPKNTKAYRAAVDEALDMKTRHDLLHSPRLYKVSDESSFGMCESLILLDLDNNELLMAGSCYGE